MDWNSALEGLIKSIIICGLSYLSKEPFLSHALKWQSRSLRRPVKNGVNRSLNGSGLIMCSWLKIKHETVGVGQSIRLISTLRPARNG